MRTFSNKSIVTSTPTDFVYRSTNDEHRRPTVLNRLVQWLGLIKHRATVKHLQGQLVFAENDICRVHDVPFAIPRRVEEISNEKIEKFERAKLMIRRMDEYLLSPEDKDEAKRQRHQDTTSGLEALVAAAHKVQKVAFREVLSVDETVSTTPQRRVSNASEIDENFRRSSIKIDPITDFQEAHDFLEFDEALVEHRKNLATKEAKKPSDFLYLKFCLIFEFQRDENESCLRILLHDIIFKFHLTDFRLRCQIHVKKPLEHELILDKTLNESHLKTNYSAQFILYSGDWIVQQEVELFIVMKIESLSINKYIGTKFFDMAHLHVKNVPHGASKIFLRELTPVNRPHRILSRGINVGQVELEAAHWSTLRQIFIHIVKISHSQAERFLRAPETFVEVVFQSPFDIHSIQRTKMAERSLNPTFNEEFLFDIPENIAVSDVTVDLIFLEKSSLHQNPVVLGVLTLSKHTDWFPVRKFWAELEENPDVKLKNSFLFEGNIED